MALDALFAADLRSANALELLQQTARQNAERQNQESIVPYAEEIVSGVSAHEAEIDERLSTFSHQWSLERMPAVDRAILRLACWELMFNIEVPAAVVISEAVKLAKEYSTEESGAFINGVLGAISTTRTAR